MNIIQVLVVSFWFGLGLSKCEAGDATKGIMFGIGAICLSIAFAANDIIRQIKESK